MNSEQSKVLITGCSGYLGQHLLHQLCTNCHHLSITAAYGTYESFEKDSSSTLQNFLTPTNNNCIEFVNQSILNFSDESTMQNFFQQRDPFDFVIHLAAISSPFVCEKNPESSMMTNCPISLLKMLIDKRQNSNQINNKQQDKTMFIFLSTDQVYDGYNAPYNEQDIATPTNIYGKSKLQFEKEITKYSCIDEHYSSVIPIILRSSLILGKVTPLGSCRKQSFLQFVHDRLSNNQPTEFFTNEYRNVVFVNDVVKVIQYFVQADITDTLKKIQGGNPIFNMGGRLRVSRYDIAKAVADITGLDSSCIVAVEKKQLNPDQIKLSSTQDEIIVHSPPDISMDISKLESFTGIILKGLDEIVSETFSS